MEEIRAILNASDVILSYHGYSPKANEIYILLSKKEHLGPCQKGTGNAIGRAHWKKSKITVVNHLDYQAMLSTLFHEMIHLYLRLDDSEIEKITSTLNARMKGDVDAIAQVLVDGTYRRAGYFAHAKISYKPVGFDHYDRDENKNIETPEKGKRYRRKKKR